MKPILLAILVAAAESEDAALARCIAPVRPPGQASRREQRWDEADLAVDDIVPAYRKYDDRMSEVACGESGFVALRPGGGCP